MSACGDAQINVTEPAVGADVRVVALLGAGRPNVSALDATEPFRHTVEGDPVDVWILGYAAASLGRAYEGLIDEPTSSLPDLLDPAFGEGSGCAARPADAVLRTRFEADSEPSYEKVDWSSWNGALDAAGISGLRFSPPAKIACPNQSAFCAPAADIAANRALDLSAGVGFASTSGGVGLPSGDVPKTVEAWFAADSCQNHAVVAGFGDDRAGKNFQIEICQGGEVRILGWGSAFDWNTGVRTAPYIDGAWHHVAATYDGATTRVFLDGEPVADTDRFTFDTDPARVVIGEEIDLGSRSFDGRIDEVRIWSRALSAEEIREGMHLEAPSTAVGLAGAWGFDSGFIDQVVDRSANGNLAILRGDAGRVDADLPLGDAAAARLVGSTRVVSFDAVGVQLDVSALSAPTTISITRLGPRQEGLRPSVPAYAPVHWLMRVFGGAMVTADLTVTVERIEAADRLQPGNLQLLQRDATSVGEWTVRASADTAAAQIAIFRNVRVFGQLILGSVGPPSCCLQACL